VGERREVVKAIKKRRNLTSILSIFKRKGGVRKEEKKKGCLYVGGQRGKQQGSKRTNKKRKMSYPYNRASLEGWSVLRLMFQAKRENRRDNLLILEDTFHRDQRRNCEVLG